MRFLHIILAISVMALWGFNFVIIHIGLQGISPFLLCCLRFLFASLPLALFVKRPKVSFKLLLAYGLINYTLQYGLMFTGMRLGMPAGLASLIYQSQVFFTILFGAMVFKEIPSASQIAGIVIAFLGISLIGFNLGGDITLAGFLLTLSAAIAWSLGNMISKQAGNINMFAFVVWGNLMAFPPAAAMTLVVDGPASVINDLQHLSLLSIFAVLYIAYASTLFCFSVWSWLLNRYPVSLVAPFTLTVPIFGIISSHLVLGEPIQSWKVKAALMILGGLMVNILGARIFKKKGIALRKS